MNSSPKTSAMLAAAMEHHRAGRLAQAQEQYRTIIATEPTNAVALHMLGLIQSHAGHHAEAEQLFLRAIAADPNSPETHNNLAISQLAMGNAAESAASARRALALRPDYGQAFSSLGSAMMNLGRPDDAIAAFGRAVEISRDSPVALYNLGTALARAGKTDRAIDAYHRALVLRPNYANCHFNLGNALRQKGLLEQAAAAYQQAATLRPDYFQALNNLGVILQFLRRYDEALPILRRAMELSPTSADAHNNVGALLRDMHQSDAAISACRKAAELNPDSVAVHANLGALYKDQGLLDQAVAEYDKVLALRPSDSSSHSNLLYTIIYHRAYDGTSLLRAHRDWNDRHAKPLGAAASPHTNDRAPDRRLRVGYVSPDFRQHCQSFFTLPLFSNHDRTNFEIFCYADVPAPDSMTERIKTYVDHWQPVVAIGDEKLAQLIRADQIDVLVDLSVHMGGNHLLAFARKPAPVQITWLGYPGTTGMDAMDWRLSDPYLDPPASSGDAERPGPNDGFYSERTYRLSDTFWCYDPLTVDPVPNDLPALDKDSVTFGCLNNLCKLNDEVLALWSRVLLAVPRSVLLVRVPPVSAQRRVLATLQQLGIDPARVQLVDNQSRLDYLKTYHRIDIALDTFPYNGHTTSIDAFWMGVPVVTLIGRTVVGRAGWSQLSNLGLTELAATDADQFVAIAKDLAENLLRLNELRDGLRQRLQESPLMDAPRFARSIESAYRQMWHQWVRSPV
jgi:protein O-GlcNAc transferase